MPTSKENYVNKLIPKYSLTEGISEKIYRKLIDQVTSKIKNLDEWHDKDTLKKIGNVGWSKSIIEIHKHHKNDINSKFYKRLAYDEILANFLVCHSPAILHLAWLQHPQATNNHGFHLFLTHHGQHNKLVNYHCS